MVVKVFTKSNNIGYLIFAFIFPAIIEEGKGRCNGCLLENITTDLVTVL